MRLICLSVDDEKESVSTRLKDKGWTIGEMYCTKGWDAEHDAIKYFNVKGIPKILIVDKEGRIEYDGHPSKVPLEDKLNELFEKEASSGETKAVE